MLPSEAGFRPGDQRDLVVPPAKGRQQPAGRRRPIASVGLPAGRRDLLPGRQVARQAGRHLLRGPSSATMRVGKASLSTVVCRISWLLQTSPYSLIIPAAAAGARGASGRESVSQLTVQSPAGTRRRCSLAIVAVQGDGRPRVARLEVHGDPLDALGAEHGQHVLQAARRGGRASRAGLWRRAAAAAQQRGGPRTLRRRPACTTSQLYTS